MALIRIPSGLDVAAPVSNPSATSLLGTVSPASVSPSIGDYTGGLGINRSIGDYSTSAPYSAMGGLSEISTPVNVGPSFTNVPISTETGLSGLGGGGYSTGVTDPSTYGGQYGGGGISVVPVNTEQYGPAIPEGFSQASQANTQIPDSFSPASQTYANPYPSGYTAPLDTYGNSPYNPQSAADIQTSYAANTASVTPDFAGGPDYGPDVASTNVAGIPTDTPTLPDTGFAVPGTIDPSTGIPDVGGIPGVATQSPADAAKKFFEWVADWTSRGLVILIGLILLAGGLWLLGKNTQAGRTVTQEATRIPSRALRAARYAI